MFPTTYTFQYNPDNLNAFTYVFSPDNLIVPLIVLGTIILYEIIYWITPHIYSFFIFYVQEQDNETKRHVIRDLVLMKEVQWELEKEIEQSLLNVTFQEKGA